MFKFVEINLVKYYAMRSKTCISLVLCLALATLLLLSCSKKDVTEEQSNSPEQTEQNGEENGNQSDPGDGKVLAFPGAEGFGKYTTGGRGGRVIKVTNLNDTGSGSLRAALTASGPRTVVFEVSGVIELKSRLTIKNGDLTVAGQTAPGDGITVANHEVFVDASNVIIRFMRFRLGDRLRIEADALCGRNQTNVIVDHCSMSWSIDECVSFYWNSDFTLQWCFITESLRNSAHPKGAHGYGGIWGGRRATFHHNLMAHHDSRNPRFGEYEGDPFALTNLIDFRNNVIYNWGNNSVYGADACNVNIVANYYKPGPASRHRERIISIGKYIDDASKLTYNVWGKFFIDGNYVHGSMRATNNNWAYGVYNQFRESYGTVSEEDKKAMRLFKPHPIDDNVTTHTPFEAYEAVLKLGGASLARDIVDTRVVYEVREGTYTYTGSKGSRNGLIDSQEDVGGWPKHVSAEVPKNSAGDGIPDEWKRRHGLEVGKGVSSGYDLSKTYTNIEVYINSLVEHLIKGDK